MSQKVGFIGLGNMGAGMAKNILAVGDPVILFDMVEEKLKSFEGTGAALADGIDQVARESDVIIFSLPAPPHVKSVMDTILANGHKGQTVLDMSTVGPDTSKEMCQAAAEKGIKYVDCPVSGGKVGAEAGNLTIMVGAAEEEMKPVAKYLEAMSKQIYYMGAIGGGTSIKLINNFMSFSMAVINAEAINMAEHMQIPLEKFYEVVLNSSGGNNNLKGKKPKVLAHDLSANFTVNLVVKDLELAADLCRKAGIPNFSANNAIQWFRLAQAMGYADKDASSLVYIFRELTKDV